MRKSFIRNLKFFDSKSKVIGVAGVSTVLALGCLCGCSSKKSDEFIDAPDIVIDSLEDDLSFEDESSNDSVVTTYENYLDFFKNSTTHTNVSTGAFGNKKKPDGRQKNIVDGNQLTTNDIISKRSSDGEIIRDISGKNSVKETNASLKTSLNTRVFTTKTTTVTEAIVTETEPETEVQTELQTEPVTEEFKGFNINDICYDRDAFVAFSKSFYLSLTYNYPNSYPVFDIGYGDTSFIVESGLTVQMLNMDYCDYSCDIISSERLSLLDNFGFYLYNFRYIKNDFLQVDIDYSRYTVNSHVGNFLNDLDKAYKEGRYHQFMEESIQNGYFNEEIMNNAGAYTILYSYDKGEFLNQDDVDNVFNDAKNSISNSLSGSSFKK